MPQGCGVLELIALDGSFEFAQQVAQVEWFCHIARESGFHDGALIL